MNPKARRRWGAAIKTVLFGAGVALLVALLIRTDTEALWGRIRQAGWFFPAALCSYVVAVLFGALAWREMLDESRSRARYRDLVAAYWAGESVNFVMPAGAPGEVAKGYFLRGRASPGELVTSITFYNLGTGVVWCGLMVLSASLVLWLTDIPPLVPYLTLTAALCLLVVTVTMRLLLRRNALGKWLGKVRRLPLIEFDPDKVETQVASMDERIRGLLGQDADRMGRLLGYITLARVFTWAEVYLLLLGLMPDHDPAWLMLVAFIAMTASQVVEFATMFVPGQVGTLEGGTAGAFALMGLSGNAGLAMELLRRGRKILAVMVTLVLGLVIRARNGPPPARWVSSSGEPGGGRPP
jgi:uncharacterized protein (TIRG00374 family)